MEKNEERKIILGVAFICTIVINAVSLIDRLNVFIVTPGGFKKAMNVFLARNTLWIISVAAIVIVLITGIRKLNLNFYSDIFKNRSICLISGSLVILEGIINLSSSLPVRIMSMNLSTQIMSQESGQSVERMVINCMNSNVISIIIVLCQIFLGFYILKFYKSKIN